MVCGFVHLQSCRDVDIPQRSDEGKGGSNDEKMECQCLELKSNERIYNEYKSKRSANCSTHSRKSPDLSQSST